MLVSENMSAAENVPVQHFTTTTVLGEDSVCCKGVLQIHPALWAGQSASAYRLTVSPSTYRLDTDPTGCGWCGWLKNSEKNHENRLCSKAKRG